MHNFIFLSTSSGICKIYQEPFHFNRTYVILSAREDDEPDRPLAVVKKKFIFCCSNFDIDSVYGQYYLEDLDIFNHSFILTKNEQTAAVISKEFFSLSDTYGVEIRGGEDHEFILALVIVLDQVLYD